MCSKINRKLVQKYQLDVGTFYFYENFMVSEITEGIALHFENASEMLSLAKKHYNNKTPFVYIAHRKNSYSFNPTAHFKTTVMFPNLKGYAVVIYDTMNKEIADMERSFMNKPVGIFEGPDKAIDWVEGLILMD